MQIRKSDRPGSVKEWMNVWESNSNIPLENNDRISSPAHNVEDEDTIIAQPSESTYKKAETKDGNKPQVKYIGREEMPQRGGNSIVVIFVIVIIGLLIYFLSTSF